MSRTDRLGKLTRDLANATPDIEAAAIVDNDGLMIASSLPAEIEEDSVAAMSAALLGISERIAGELERGDFEMVMVRGGQGFVVISRAGDDAVLAVLTTTKAKLGLIFLDVKRASGEIAGLLG